MNVVIIGGHGFVGKNIQAVLSASSNVDKISCFSRQKGFDLLNEDIDANQKHTLLDADFIINCAADVGSLNYVTEKAGVSINILLDIIIPTSKFKVWFPYDLDCQDGEPSIV